MKRYEDDDETIIIGTTPAWNESFHVTESINNQSKHTFYKQFFGKRSKEK